MALFYRLEADTIERKSVYASQRGSDCCGESFVYLSELSSSLFQYFVPVRFASSMMPVSEI